MIGLIQQGRFGCGRERPALDLGRDCSFAKRVERPPERMDSSASLSRTATTIFSTQTANSFQGSRSVAASRNLNLFANVQVEFHRQSTPYFHDRNKTIACGQSFVTGAVGFKKREVLFHARLRSAVGEREKWSGERRGALSRTKPERNARRRAADGSPPLRRPCTLQARDERAVCGVEWATAAREAKQTARWSRRNLDI